MFFFLSEKETIKLSNLTLPDVTNTTKFLAQTDELPPQQSLIKSETMTTTVWNSYSEKNIQAS